MACAFAIALPLHALLFPFVTSNASLIALSAPAFLVLLDFALGSPVNFRLGHVLLPVLATVPNIIMVSVRYGFEIDALIPTLLVASAAVGVFLLSQMSLRFESESRVYQPIL